MTMAMSSAREDAYERGFVDGMSRQAQSSVDKAVNAMSQRTWVGLTFAEICECESEYLNVFARAIEAKLKEKNNAA